MKRSKANRGQLEWALAQVRSDTMKITGKHSDGSPWTKEEKVADLEARIDAMPPEKSKGRAKVERGRTKERERIEKLMETDQRSSGV